MSKYPKWERNIAEFSTKSTSYWNFRVCGLVPTMESACTRFCMHNAMQSALKRQNISSGRQISLNSLQNRRIIAICVCLGVFLRWKTRALRSSRLITQCKMRLNVAISRTGEKYRIIFDKIDEWMRFACIWACFDDVQHAHYVVHAYFIEQSV